MVGGDGGGSGVRIGFDVGLLIELNEIRNPVKSISANCVSYTHDERSHCIYKN